MFSENLSITKRRDPLALDLVIIINEVDAGVALHSIISTEAVTMVRLAFLPISLTRLYLQTLPMISLGHPHVQEGSSVQTNLNQLLRHQRCSLPNVNIWTESQQWRYARLR